MKKLFVYGTLKQKKSNHYLLRNSKYLGRYHTVNRYKLTEKFGIPILLEKYNNKQIEGECYEVSKLLLKYVIDRLESHPFVYKRKEIKITNENNTIKAWCYFYNLIRSK